MGYITKLRYGAELVWIRIRRVRIAGKPWNFRIQYIIDKGLEAIIYLSTEDIIIW